MGGNRLYQELIACLSTLIYSYREVIETLQTEYGRLRPPQIRTKTKRR